MFIPDNIADLRREIARIGLSIGAIKLYPSNPITWASGWKSPIYNDNRMLLGNYRHRMLVRDGFVKLLDILDWNPDFICATSLSGIAPAASVANKLNKPLVIIHEGEPFHLNTHSFDVEHLEFIRKKANIIISTAPWMIPLAIDTANETELPFAYLRPEAKAHGKGKRLEGVTDATGSMYFFHRNSDDVLEMMQVLVDEGFTPIGSETDAGLPAPKKATDLSGNSCIVIEDLISTGGSALKEVDACRKAGAHVFSVLSIFNYGLEKAAKQFADANCQVNSILTYDTMLDVGIAEKKFTEDELVLLKEWRENPVRWSNIHGGTNFPE